MGLILFIIVAIILTMILRSIGSSIKNFFSIIIGGIAVIFFQYKFIAVSILLLFLTVVTGAVPVFLLGEGICIFYFYKRWKKKKAILAENKRKIEIWKEQGKVVDKDINILMGKLIDEFKVNYINYFDYSDMPYG